MAFGPEVLNDEVSCTLWELYGTIASNLVIARIDRFGSGFPGGMGACCTSGSFQQSGALV